MSRFLITLSLVTLLVAGIAVAGDAPWLDMENCAMCSSMAAQKGLMENMSWQQYNITSGIVSVTNVNADYLPAYREAHKEMYKTVGQLQSGEMLELCGSCMAMGACMMKGAHQDYVETPTGDLWVVTATDPAVVAELHDWVKRNQEEMAKKKAAKG